MQESPGRKPDWQTVKSSFSIKYSNIDVNIVFLNILADIAGRLTPNKTVPVSWFKRRFLFDIISLTSWKEPLYNSTFTCQILFSRGICKFEFSQ